MNTRTPVRAALALAVVLASASLSGCALIAAPIYAQQKDAAVEAQAKADLINALIAAESYAVSNNGAYPTDSDELVDNGYTPGPGMSNMRILVSDGGTRVCLDVTADSGAVYKLLPGGNADNYADGECTDADVN